MPQRLYLRVGRDELRFELLHRRRNRDRRLNRRGASIGALASPRLMMDRVRIVPLLHRCIGASS